MVEIATCSLCGFTSSESLPALGHEWTYTVTEPTCTQEGSNTMVCSVCHEQHIESTLLQDIIYQQLLSNQPIRKMAVSQQHALSATTKQLKFFQNQKHL